MKASGKACQKRCTCSNHHVGGNDTANNNGSGNPHGDGIKVIEIDDSSESDKKPATFNTIIHIDSSSEEEEEEELAREESSNANAINTVILPRKRQKQRNKTKASQGGKQEKGGTAPAFTVDRSDPFLFLSTAVGFVVRGKPHPQYRDKPGWNFTQYNPSKKATERVLQSGFNHLLYSFWICA
jgi:hypothetical protein